MQALSKFCCQNKRCPDWITENVVQIIYRCAADSAKMTIYVCYTAEHARSDFPNEKAHHCSV